MIFCREWEKKTPQQGGFTTKQEKILAGNHTHKNKVS